MKICPYSPARRQRDGSVNFAGPAPAILILDILNILIRGSEGSVTCQAATGKVILNHFGSIDWVYSLLLGSVETNMKTQFLLSWLVSLRGGGENTEWTFMLMGGGQLWLLLFRFLSMESLWSESFHLRGVRSMRSLSLEWPGLRLFLLRTEKQWSLFPL